MNTETPETDAILMESWMSINFPDSPIPAAFAKRLEMERNEARRLAEMYRKMAYDCKWPKPGPFGWEVTC